MSLNLGFVCLAGLIVFVVVCFYVDESLLRTKPLHGRLIGEGDRRNDHPKGFEHFWLQTTASNSIISFVLLLVGFGFSLGWKNTMYSGGRKVEERTFKKVRSHRTKLQNV